MTVSPVDLSRHIEILVRSDTVLDDDSGTYPITELATASHSRCSAATDAVEAHLDTLGIAYRGVSYDTGISFMAIHYATEVPTQAGPYIVDLAFGQYDPDSPWPLVEPREDYLERTGFTEESSS